MTFCNKVTAQSPNQFDKSHTRTVFMIEIKESFIVNF